MSPVIMLMVIRYIYSIIVNFYMFKLMCHYNYACMCVCVCLQVTSLLNRLANVSTDNLPHYLLIHGTGDGTVLGCCVHI